MCVLFFFYLHTLVFLACCFFNNYKRLHKHTPTTQNTTRKVTQKERKRSKKNAINAILFKLNFSQISLFPSLFFTLELLQGWAPLNLSHSHLHKTNNNNNYRREILNAFKVNSIKYQIEYSLIFSQYIARFFFLLIKNICL